MYNYRLTISNETMEKLNNFNATMRLLATRSCEVNTEKKRLEEIRDNTDNTEEEIREAITDLKKLEEAWKVERKEYDRKLYGGKDKDGKKVGGYCDSISKEYYKAYCAYITDAKKNAMMTATKNFLVGACVEGTDVKDRAITEFTNELLIVLGGKINGNSKLAKGESFITTVNERTFKKMVFGAICDVIAKTTIKTEEKTEK